MLGVLANSVLVLVGGLLGVLLGKAVPQRVGDVIMKALGLCVIYIGVSGSLEGQNTLVLIISIVIGTFIGETLDLDGRLTRFANRMEQRFRKGGVQEGQKSLAEGFVTTTIIMCTGAMAILGPLQASLNGDNSIIFAKATIDFVAAIIFASTMGLGVALTSVSLLIYQGFFALAGGLLSPLLTDYAVAEITCAGSMLLIGLGLNMLGLTKLKIMNLLPSIFMPILLCLIIK